MWFGQISINIDYYKLHNQTWSLTGQCRIIPVESVLGVVPLQNPIDRGYLSNMSVFVFPVNTARAWRLVCRRHTLSPIFSSDLHVFSRPFLGIIRDRQSVERVYFLSCHLKTQLAMVSLPDVDRYCSYYPLPSHFLFMYRWSGRFRVWMSFVWEDMSSVLRNPADGNPSLL